MKVIFLILLLALGAFALQHNAHDLGVYCEGGYQKGVGKHPRIYYYYDKGVKNCVQFVYFGSGGNKNRHETREKCQKACNVKVGTKVSTA
uniref:BPTI/Kunitz inhibitor domain-containing protein n=1 Tax=Panagrolaimus sp. PS1159 TaxID=55785 RepID=A0AC35GFC1_9BILA